MHGCTSDLLRRTLAQYAKEAFLAASIKSNRLDSRAGRDLVDAYKNSHVLVGLLLSQEEVGAEVFDELIRVSDLKRSTGVDPFADEDQEAEYSDVLGT